MVNKICNILIGIILISMILVASMFFLPNLLGYSSLAVVSGSMAPHIPVGSLVYVKEVPFEDIKNGDVISFYMFDDTLVTHRISSIDTKNQQFITKGDANNTEDGTPIAYKNVKGKVAFSLPLLGYISIYIKTPLGISGACAILFIVILLNFIPDLMKKGYKEIE